MPPKFLLTQFLCKGGNFRKVRRRYRRHYLYARSGVRYVLTLFQHTLHHLCGDRRPRAVFDKTYRPVLIVPLGKRVYKSAHKREYIPVVSGGGKHEFIITERVLYRLSHIATRQVVHSDRYAAGFKFLCKFFRRLFRVSVNRGVSNRNALVFRLVFRPLIVKVYVVGKVKN